MNPHYNQNYKIEQIEEILNTIHDCIKKGHYTISRNERRSWNG